MNISKIGIDLIKSFEGCQLKAYLCPGGVWTIGWGTTEPINGVKPHEGMTITQKQADDLLIKNLKSYESAVNKYVKVTINQNQYDALVSFTYNCGCGALQKSTLLQYINQGKYEDAANQFDLWNKAAGKVLVGLTRRRAAEKKLFLTSTSVVEDKELSNAISKIIRSGIDLDFDKWKRKDLIKLADVPFLVCKLAGIKVIGVVSKEQYKQAIDKLVLKECISQRLIWDEKRYTDNNVRSLLIKFSKLG